MAKVQIDFKAQDNASSVIDGLGKEISDLAKTTKNAGQSLNDFDRALGEMARSARKAETLDIVRKKLERMSDAEKDAAIAAVDFADAQEEAARAAAKMGDDKGMGWTELKSQIDLALCAIEKFAQAAQKVYEFGKAGAELEYAAKKFDRLTQTIGTVSGALMNDLRKATQGTMSDAELMASAGDMMSLGLAKTHDQTVRLAKVTSGLGMDMNQLVLTLSNQTTMRFDQLGVSVAGFDEKVQALVDTGMNANDAFNEAFLRQAEEQLLKVGNAADENIGSFKRFEAAAKNLTDQVKKDATPAIADLADALADVLEQASKNAEYSIATKGMTDVQRGAFMAQGAIVGMTDAERKARDEFQRNRTAVDNYSVAINNYSVAINNLSPVMKNQAYDWERIAATGQNAYMAFWEAKTAAEAMAAYADRLAIAEGNLKTAQDELATAQTSWKDKAGGQIAGMLEKAKLETEDYYTALNVVDSVQGTNTATVARQQDAMGKLVEEYAKTKDVEAFRQGLINLNDTFMPLNESVAKSMQLVQDLQSELEGMARVYTATVRIRKEGFGGEPGGGGTVTYPSVEEEEEYDGKVAVGGWVNKDRRYLVGENGPELFVPSQSGTVIPNQTTNYILNAYHTQSQNAVERAFSIMRAWGSV